MFRWDDRREVSRFVAHKLLVLQQQFVEDQRPSARAMLARLRREVAKEPGISPDTREFEFGDLPEGLAGKGASAPTAGEYAVHLSCTLYAVHQQSQHKEMFQKTNVDAGELHGLGHAINQLSYINRRNNKGEQLEQGEMPRRFAALIKAESMKEIAHYARQLIQQLRAESISLDYGLLAAQLYAFYFPAMRDQVRREWGREFSQWRPLEQVVESKDE